MNDIDFVGFKVPANTAAIACCHVLEGQPITVVSHDDDGEFQFLCGAEKHVAAETRIVCIGHMAEQLGTERFPIAFLPSGKIALQQKDGSWEVDDRQPDEERE